mgnify:CR=1 FL=1
MMKLEEIILALLKTSPYILLGIFLNFFMERLKNGKK